MDAIIQAEEKLTAVRAEARGSCDFETGICQCFPGFTGVACRRTTCPKSCRWPRCLCVECTNLFATKETYFKIRFTDRARDCDSRPRPEVKLPDDVECVSGMQPKFANEAAFNPTCTVSREPSVGLREKAGCSNRSLCNCKTVNCYCLQYNITT